MTTKRKREFEGRTDADPQLAQLPALAPREMVHARIMQELDRWEPGAGNLLICGPTKAGKTSGAAIRMRDLLAERLDATSMIFAEAQELVSNPTLLERAMVVRFLVVDDLGQEDDRKNLLFRVYNERYKRGLDTITTTGWKLEDLERRGTMGSHLIRRILEYSRGGRLTRGKVVSVFAPKPSTAKRAAVGTEGNPVPWNERAEA